MKAEKKEQENEKKNIKQHIKTNTKVFCNITDRQTNKIFKIFTKFNRT